VLTVLVPKFRPWWLHSNPENGYAQNLAKYSNTGKPR
jgi:hypothetical protein